MEKVEQIKHRFHRHPLVLVEEQSDQNEKPYCSGCGEVVSGSSFSCVDCNYHLHKECAQAPSKIEHPLHPQHSGFFLQESPCTYSWYACALCKEKRNMFFYECVDCMFALDIKCFLLSNKVGESIHEFKVDGHELPFIFLENHKDELKKVYCSWCHQSLIDSIYVSVDCKFHLHKKCLNIEIDHPVHRLHTLVLHFAKEDCFCKVCEKEDHHQFFYRCFACKFDIHLECTWQRPIIEDEKYHEHPFTLLFRNDSFICDACGTNGKFVSYICHTCNLQVHKNCTSLPRIIKVTRHHHAIFHKHFLKKKELEKHDCQICFDEVKTEHGSYHCLRKDCNYIVHVNCATENENLYYIIDQENQDEEADETNKATDSSITCVIEENQHGEAIKIEHFNHEHYLVLQDKINEASDRNCDGCMLAISTPFYYCSECNFFLHKPCAELPKIKHHWFHRFAATLQAKNFERCDLCNRFCSGLFYTSERGQGSGRFDFCLRCATVPNIIKRQGHEHFLFFDYKCKGQCNACGVGSEHGAFRCRDCNFTLDFACMTLPQAIQHKCDDHLLRLTYHDENDDTEQHYCDICEGKRNPNHWYYCCSTCDNYVHPECVLGKYPFIKDGTTVRHGNHPHKLSFVQKVDGYPKCTVCGKLCLDEALKCSTCNFIFHWECVYKYFKQERSQFDRRWWTWVASNY